MRRSFARVALAALIFSCGCTEDPPLVVDGGLDGGGVCAADSECSDGLFCNGEETCDPGAASADDRGCVASTADACAAGETCDEDADLCETPCDVQPDADGDGSRARACGGTDCDDADPERFPGNTEVCDPDDHDEDCDPTTFGVRDADLDGSPDLACCNLGTDGTPICGDDCDDARAGVHPTAPEVCDGRDTDCDGVVDEDVLVTYYVDGDGDHYGSAAVDATTMQGCTLPEGFAESNDDCDDGDDAVHPGAPDVCDLAMVDDDCDGTPNNPTGGCACSVGAPPRACTLSGVCSGGNEACLDGMWGACSIMPVTEVCDGLDEDCDGTVDDGVTITCYADGDGDGYALAGTASAQRCPDATRPTFGNCPAGFTATAPLAPNDDCNDANPGLYPNNPELCDGIDQDCDALVDEGRTIACYADTDNDGYAAMGIASSQQCPDAARVTVGGCPSGYTNRAPADIASIDCGEGNPDIRPLGTEICNGVDDDCDGVPDDGLRVSCWADGDDDSYALAAAATGSYCRDPGRPSVGGCPSMQTNRDPATASSRDCDDTRADVNPGRTEACNSRDDDCDGTTDEPGATGELTYYHDVDGDGFGTSTMPLMACTAPSGYVSLGTDCNDAVGAINPAAMELCNGINDDCDTATDEPPAVANSCPVFSGTTYACTSGMCLVSSCPAGRGDCDTAPSNGCEVDTTTAYLHCGMCGTTCRFACTSSLCDEAVEVSAGSFHSCLRQSTGRVACWGRNDRSQIGDGTDFNRDQPRSVVGLSDAIRLSIGGSHSCAIRTGGQAVCWGDNTYGQLGTGDTTLWPTPRNVSAVGDATRISAAVEHTCAIRGTGRAVCWGRNQGGQVGDPSLASLQTSSYRTVCGAFSGGVCTAQLLDATAISTGLAHSCAIRTGGQVVCWGSDAFGELGNGNPDQPDDCADLAAIYGVTDCRRTYVAVSGLTDATALAVGFGGTHACAIRSGGQVVCWGSNVLGQLGDNTTIDRGLFVNAMGVPDAIAIAAGGAHSCAIRSGGSVVCWGAGTAGQLGQGAFTSSRVPVAVSGLTDAVGIWAGDQHTCALRATGQVVCWGNANYYQVGDGTTTNRNVPTAVRPLYVP